MLGTGGFDENDGRDEADGADDSDENWKSRKKLLFLWILVIPAEEYHYPTTLDEMK